MWGWGSPLPRKPPETACWRPGGAQAVRHKQSLPSWAPWKIPTLSRGGPGWRPRQQHAPPGRQPGLSGFPGGTGCRQEAGEGRRLGTCFPLSSREGKSDFQELSCIQEPSCLERTLSLHWLVAKGSNSASWLQWPVRASGGRGPVAGGAGPGGGTARGREGSGQDSEAWKGLSRGRVAGRQQRHGWQAQLCSLLASWPPDSCGHTSLDKAVLGASACPPVKWAGGCSTFLRYFFQLFAALMMGVGGSCTCSHGICP